MMDEELRGTENVEVTGETETVAEAVAEVVAEEATAETEAVAEQEAIEEVSGETEAAVEAVAEEIVTETVSENTEENVLQPAEEQTYTGGQEVWRHPEESPYSPLYIPEQKKQNHVTIILVVILVLFLIGGLIFAVSKLVEAAMNEMGTEATAWEETFSEWKEALEEKKEKDQEDSKANSKETEDSDNSHGEDEIIWSDDWLDDDPDEDDWNKNWDDDWDAQGNADGYIPDEDDEYYVEIVDSIRNDLDYYVDKEYYTYDDVQDSVSIWVDYCVVEGTGFDAKINEALEEGAMYYAKTFGADEGVTDFYLVVESYVTYMDEDILSVVVWEEYMWGEEIQVDLYCMNFDMNTGALLYNTEIIDPSMRMVEEFREMNEYQNGYIDYVEECSDEDIMDLFTDESSLILFYTPVGLEIGFNYEYGWVTATLKDYEDYLSRL